MEIEALLFFYKSVGTALSAQINLRIHKYNTHWMDKMNRTYKTAEMDHITFKELLFGDVEFKEYHIKYFEDCWKDYSEECLKIKEVHVKGLKQRFTKQFFGKMLNACCRRKVRFYGKI